MCCIRQNIGVIIRKGGRMTLKTYGVLRGRCVNVGIVADQPPLFGSSEEVSIATPAVLWKKFAMRHYWIHHM